MSIGTAFGRIAGVNAAASARFTHPEFKKELAYAAGH
jgi:tricarballylate dehydrogenase